MTLDPLIISDSGSDGYSSANLLKLSIYGKIADNQVVKNFLLHNELIKSPNDSDGRRSWAFAKRLMGLALLDYFLGPSLRLSFFFSAKSKNCYIISLSPKIE